MPNHGLEPTLLLPLIVDSQWLGVVCIDHPEPAAITPEDLIVFKAFAYQADKPLPAFKSISAKMDGLSRLNTLNLNIVRALDLNELLIRIETI